jgi:hypothetical protein
MMKVNTSIHTLHLLDFRYSKDELYRESIAPYLATNRHRSHVRAIQKTRSIAYRTKVLGQALFAARTDPNRFWMLLSGNAEIAFPSTTATTTPAANLPTPSNAAAATSNTAAIAITTAVTVTAIRAASTTDASAVDIVAPRTTCRKRTARP